MQNQKGISTIAGITIFIVVAVFAFGGVFAYEYYLQKNEQKIEADQNQNLNNNTEPVACTMEAKICPDGSSVGRSGPNCEFSACPDQTDTETSFSSQIQEIKDCGISDSMTKNVPLDKIDFERDAALVCLGKSIANNCIHARAVLKGSRGDEELVEISGVDSASCKIKETIIKDSIYPLYINKYMECSINKIDEFGYGKIKTPAEILKNPGTYTGGLASVLNLFFLNTNQAIGELGCTSNFNSADLK